MSDRAVTAALAGSATAAATAPTALHVQPWRFVLHTGSLDLFADPDGPLSREETLLTCGGAVQRALAALAADGLRIEVELLPDDDPDHVATLTPAPSAPVDAAVPRVAASAPTAPTPAGARTAPSTPNAPKATSTPKAPKARPGRRRAAEAVPAGRRAGGGLPAAYAAPGRGDGARLVSTPARTRGQGVGGAGPVQHLPGALRRQRRTCGVGPGRAGACRRRGRRGASRAGAYGLCRRGRAASQPYRPAAGASGRHYAVPGPADQRARDRRQPAEATRTRAVIGGDPVADGPRSPCPRQNPPRGRARPPVATSPALSASRTHPGRRARRSRGARGRGRRPDCGPG